MTKWDIITAWADSRILVGMTMGAAMKLAQMASVPIWTLSTRYYDTATIGFPVLCLFFEPADPADTKWQEQVVVRTRAIPGA